MSGPRSDAWHRVAAAQPRLRRETRVERQVVRGRVWYVARDPFGARAWRLSPAVWRVLMRMDGRRSLDRIWREIGETEGEEAPSQDRILGLVAELHAAELISSDGAVDLSDTARRAEEHLRATRWRRVRNPMFLLIPLVDPDRFLARTAPLFAPLVSPLGALAWVLVVGWFLASAASHFDALTANVSDRVLAGDGVFVFLATFPALKVLHELGHAYAVKLFGGEVHEIGLSFLTFMPAPYVDASDSAAFPHRRQRVAVAAAGMAVELVAAAGALAVWLNAEPGLIRAVAFDAVFVASVSTVVFNANPLLRFDGYYILSEWLGVPGLASRSSRLWIGALQRRAFGLKTPPLAREPGLESVALWLYAPASLAYRLVVIAGVAFFVGTHYFFFGVAMVLWMLATSLALPMLKTLRFVLLAPEMQGRRLRGAGALGGAAALVAALLVLIPAPDATIAQGVVAIGDDARLVAGSAGTVTRFLVEPGAHVVADTPLIALEDPFLTAKRDKARARVAELAARLTAAEPRSIYDTQLARGQLEVARGELDDVLRRERELTIRAGVEGTFIAPDFDRLAGAFVKQGETLGYVMSETAPTIRVAAREDDIDRVRGHVVGVSLRFGEGAFEKAEPAQILRVAPGATHRLPSPALTSANGGPFALDPADKQGEATLEPLFLVELTTDSQRVRDRWGQRVQVRFDHGAAPIGYRLWRLARQTFLGRFHV